jgi:hypothetical protein
LQACPFDFATSTNLTDDQKHGDCRHPDHGNVGKQQMPMGPIQQSRQPVIKIRAFTPPT